MEVSLVVATYNNPEGLYLSVFAALQQLEKCSFPWEIIISADNGVPQKYEQAHKNIRVLRLTGGNRTGSPQGTRDAGIRVAQYKNVLCIDSHVIISDIERWTDIHEKLAATISFPAMIGASGEMWKLYGSEFDWEKSFWYTHVLSEPASPKPYKILQTSHSGFMVSRDWYLSSGGYTNLQDGYGGEETFLGIKSWMTGGENYMIPEISHAHYQPAGRNEGAEHKENYKRNFMVAAYVMGGRKYLDYTEQFYNARLKITPDIEEERQRIVRGKFHGDLDLFREYLKNQAVVN